MDQLSPWFLLGVPLGCLAFGLLSYGWVVLESRRLDRLDGKRG